MFDRRRLAHLNETHELQRVVLWIPARPGEAKEAKCQEADEEPERKLVHAARLEEDRHPDDRKLAAAPVGGAIRTQPSQGEAPHMGRGFELRSPTMWVL